MGWVEDTQKAINYIETNLFKDINAEDIAVHIHRSSDYFQKMFLMVTDFSVSEYIRNRRLSLAGQELAVSKNKVIDVALKYGYETPASFTKAFTRFHGFTPSKIYSSENQLKCFNPLTIKINIKGGFIMSRNLLSSVEKLVQTITYKGVEFEIVERPDVLWAGSVDYATNNTDESDIDATLKRFQSLVEPSPIIEKINPDWSASISINYTCNDKPCGIMFANETYSDKQDERYDLFTQPGGLWLRIRNDKNASVLLLGKDDSAPYEYFAGAQVLQNAAKENGYMQNPDIHIQIEYHCHAEYGTPPHTNYAYIPIIKI